jgi:hypothetical protein
LKNVWPNWMRSAPRSRPGSAKQERANDTRRKVLLGALVLHRLENGKDEFSRRLGEWLKRELPDFLTRPGDKELFADLIGNAPAGETTGSAGEAPHESGETCMGRVQEHDAAGRA